MLPPLAPLHLHSHLSCHFPLLLLIRTEAFFLTPCPFHPSLTLLFLIILFKQPLPRPHLSKILSSLIRSLPALKPSMFPLPAGESCYLAPEAPHDLASPPFPAFVHHQLCHPQPQPDGCSLSCK